MLKDRAALFVDGRYTLQGREQTDTDVFEVVLISEQTPEAWIEAEVPSGRQARLRSLAVPHRRGRGAGARLHGRGRNAGRNRRRSRRGDLDAIAPPRPSAPSRCTRSRTRAKPPAAKLARVRAELGKARADALVVSNPTAVAWAFNIRGADVTHTPLALAFAMVPAEGRPSLFVDGRKLSNTVRDELERLADVLPTEALRKQPRPSLGKGKATVRLDSASAADAIAKIIRDAGGKVVNGQDPITLMKAVKNATEIAGSRAAHRRDGAAIANFLAWFDREAPRGQISARSIASAPLETFRRDTGALKDVSFPTISGSGPERRHRALPRHRGRPIAGSRQANCSCSIPARNISTARPTSRARSPIGTPSEEMRDRFTRVLKGHIGIARAIFPEAPAARSSIPSRASTCGRPGSTSTTAPATASAAIFRCTRGRPRSRRSTRRRCKRGMILSNEPGYYKTGAYGIRIENLVLVVEAPAVPGAEKPLNAFETLTLAPIDRRLSHLRLLTADETAGSMRIMRGYAPRSARCSTRKRRIGSNRRQRRSRDKR